MQNDYNNWQDEVNQRPAHNNSSISDMPMKWHKFMIYFSLWAGALSNVLSGIGLLTGSVYNASGSDAEMIYLFYDGLKGMDVLFGLVSLAMAVLLIVTRFALAGYKENGPKLLIACYAASAVVAILYPLLVSGITGMGFAELFDATSLVTGIVMCIANKNYYDKRAHMFVN